MTKESKLTVSILAFINVTDCKGFLLQIEVPFNSNELTVKDDHLAVSLQQ